MGNHVEHAFSTKCAIGLTLPLPFIKMGGGFPETIKNESKKVFSWIVHQAWKAKKNKIKEGPNHPKTFERLAILINFINYQTIHHDWID